MASPKDLAGLTFGMLKVIAPAPRPEGASYHGLYWECECLRCGAKGVVKPASKILSGHVSSCGCFGGKQPVTVEPTRQMIREFVKDMAQLRRWLKTSLVETRPRAADVEHRRGHLYAELVVGAGRLSVSSANPSMWARVQSVLAELDDSLVRDFERAHHIQERRRRENRLHTPEAKA